MGQLLSEDYEHKIKEAEREIEKILFPKSNSTDPLVRAEGYHEEVCALIFTSNSHPKVQILNYIEDSFNRGKTDLANSIVSLILLAYSEKDRRTTELPKDVKDIQGKFEGKSGISALRLIIEGNKKLLLEAKSETVWNC